MSTDSRRRTSEKEKEGIEWIRDNRDQFEELAEADLPVSDTAQRILRKLDEEEVSE